MSIKSLFNIILKIIGLFFIKDILALVPQFISVLFYLINADTYGEAFWTLISAGLTLGIYLVVINYLVFRTNTVIEKFKLDEGFEEETISFKIHRSVILSISIIVIGGLILADEIPNFCNQLFAYFQGNRLYKQENRSMSNIIFSGAKIIIGLILVGNQREIVNFIEMKRKKIVET